MNKKSQVEKFQLKKNELINYIIDDETGFYDQEIITSYENIEAKLSWVKKIIEKQISKLNLILESIDLLKQASLDTNLPEIIAQNPYKKYNIEFSTLEGLEKNLSEQIERYQISEFKTYADRIIKEEYSETDTNHLNEVLDTEPDIFELTHYSIDIFNKLNNKLITTSND